MTLVVTPTFAYLTGEVPAEALDGLRATLRYKRKEFRREIRRGQAPRLQADTHWYSLLHESPGQVAFPAGLVPRALAVLGQHGVTPDVTHEVPAVRWEPWDWRTLPDGTVLYDDQYAAHAAAVQHQRGLLALATNFGKTTLGAAVFRTFRPERGLFLTDARALLQQNADELSERLREPVGVLGGGRVPRGERVIVAMVQTLHRALTATNGTHGAASTAAIARERLEVTKVLVVDEVHTVASANMGMAVLGRMPAPVRIGMSGTVYEAENLIVEEAHLGPVLLAVDNPQLMAQGRSARAAVFMPLVGSLVADSRDYEAIYTAGVVNNTQRNAVLTDVTWRLVQRGLRAVVLFYRLEHGRDLARQLEALGARAALLDGGTPPRAIEQAKADLTARRLDVILASTIWTKGVNLPGFEVLVNAAAWKSPLATKQKLGRGLRKKLEGENRVIVLDPWDLGNRTLKEHSLSRESTYRRSGCTVHRGELTALLPALDGA